MRSYSVSAGPEEIIANIFGGVNVIFALVFLVLYIVAYWRIFEKAGLAGWKSLIPFYSQYCMYRISFGSDKGWMFILTLVPCVGQILEIIRQVKLSQNFGHGTGFALGLIFLTNIFYLILGFDSSQYIGEPLV